MVHLPSCQLHISVNRTAQIYLELHFCVELHTKKSPAAQRIWNSLPLYLRSFTISQEQFRARLKTHLFKCAYT